MTARDHNKALIIIYGLLGGFFSVLVLASPLIIPATVDDIPSPRREDQVVIAAVAFCVALAFALTLSTTAYGLYRGRPWARISALILAVLFIWSFPLGTAIGIYTYWFLHSEDGKRLFSKH